MNNIKEKGSSFVNKYGLILLLIVMMLFTTNKLFFAGGVSAGSSNGNPMLKMGIAYYLERSNEEINAEEVEARIRNFGCHSEIHIFRDGNLVMRLGYSRGKVYEL